MKRYLLLLILIIGMIGCRTSKQTEPPPVLKDSIRIVERLVPVQLPADSSILEAYFECDSTNRVIMKELSEEKSKRVSTKLNFSPGKLARLDYKSNTKPDTVYISGKDITIYKDRPVYIDKPIVTNKLNWWQKVLMWGGGVFSILLLIAIYSKIKPFIK